MSESATATPAEGRPSRPSTAGRARGTDPQRGIIATIVLFCRQAISELKKVVWPTRHELSTYVVIVLVFVVVVMTFIGLVDLGVGQLMLWIFGGGGASATGS